MTERRRLTHVVIDTDVASWLLDPRPSPHAEAARRVIGDRSRVVSFVTVTELRYGALRAGWGEFRGRQLERSLADLDVIQTTEVLIYRCVSLRADQSRSGHALAQKIHETDRWVAATAVALELEWWRATGYSRTLPASMSIASVGDRTRSSDGYRAAPATKAATM